METSAARDVKSLRRPREWKPSPRKLSEEMTLLAREFGEHAVTFRRVIYVLGGRAYMLLVVLMVLPFLLPIPVPGLSTLAGVVIAAIALRLAMGQRPWLSKKIQRREIPGGFFPKVLELSAKIIRFLEKFLRPRWFALTGSGFLLQAHAVMMLASALVLLLPLPIPLSNGLPAWSILFLAGGLMERDGLFVFFGYVACALSVIYLWLFGEAAQHLSVEAWHWFQNWRASP